jgi:cellulose synthase/poly-beta-1,6-N-acetylglucosamine synthase-like glycosyltransferase
LIWLSVFAVCCAGIAWVIAGYPLLLKWIAARWGRPANKQPQTPKISILIAVHNGDRFLADKLDSIVKLDYPRELMEVYVLSDGSTDRTAEIARSYAGHGIQLLELPKGGKPAALNAGISRSTGEILVLTDVRQVLEPGSVRQLVANFADPTIGVVSGDLPTRKGIDLEEETTSLYWRYERALRMNLGRLGSTFGATGPFYAIRRELTSVMPPETLLDDMYLPLGAFFRGYRLIVDETARAFDYPLSIRGEFRRKVRTLAGNYQIISMYPALLTPHNRMLFHFLSYKVGRLALPWLFLGALIASFGLPRPWNEIVVTGQLAFYGLAAIDALLPEKSAFRRLSTPARTVVAMLSAAALGLSVFFVDPQRLWVVTQARRRD